MENHYMIYITDDSFYDSVEAAPQFDQAQEAVSLDDTEQARREEQMRAELVGVSFLNMLSNVLLNQYLK